MPYYNENTVYYRRLTASYDDARARWRPPSPVSTTLFRSSCQNSTLSMKKRSLRGEWCTKFGNGSGILSFVSKSERGIAEPSSAAGFNRLTIGIVTSRSTIASTRNDTDSASFFHLLWQRPRRKLVALF